jgi:hypothetical protein
VRNSALLRTLMGVAVTLAILSACGTSGQPDAPVPPGDVVTEDAPPPATPSTVTDVANLCDAMTPSEVGGIMQIPTINTSLLEYAPRAGVVPQAVCTYYVDGNMAGASTVRFNVQRDVGSSRCTTPFGVDAKTMSAGMGDKSCGYGNTLWVEEGPWHYGVICRFSFGDVGGGPGTEEEQRRLRELMRVYMTRFNLS